MNQQCPSCGAPREGSTRFCPNCGLDFWRAAAGETPPPAPLSAVGQQKHTNAGSAAAPVLIVAGGLLGAAALAVAVIVWVLPGAERSPESATVVPTPVSEEDALIREFFREARDPNAAFAVTGESTLTVEGPSAGPAPVTTTTTAVQIHGEDWIGDVTIAQEGSDTIVADVAYVDGTLYVREGAALEWTSRELPRAQLGPVNPFARISTVLEIAHLGTDAVDGEELEHLQVTKWLGGNDFDDLLVNIAITDQEITLDIWTTAAGVPVS